MWVKDDLLIVEMKTKVNDLEGVRSKLSLLDAKYIGEFHQIDTYFETSEGRLKLRETNSQDYAEIIFYERPDIAKIKKSHILLIRARPPDIAKKLLDKFLPTKLVVEKTREIYTLEKIRVHLDQVKGLGAFVELERPTKDEIGEINKSKSMLANIGAKLGFKDEDFEALSYADLLDRPPLAL
jgi:adenylate cyclase class 2